VASTLNSEELPTGVDMACVSMRPAPTDSGFVDTSSAFMIGLTPTAILTIPPTSPTNSFDGWVCQGILPTKFNHSGAYFTGLSYTTTLTLNAIFYIEKFPSQLDTDLVVLAKHSCRSDTIARALYSEIVREMPVGVPQRMNGMGEWFADAVSSAADFISPVLGAIPLPMTQGLSGIVKSAGNVAKALGSKRESANPYNPTGNNTAMPIKVVVKKPVAQKKKAKVKTKGTKK